jgi:hypothetical protein
MSRTQHFLGFALLAAVLNPMRLSAEPLPALPIVPQEHVDRAIAISRLNALDKMLNEFVVPNWIGGSHKFWYQREVPGGEEWLVVDAESGAKQALFDIESVLQATANGTDSKTASRGSRV